MKRFLMMTASVLCFLFSFSQKPPAANATKWVDSVFKSLNQDEKIAQLMVVRLSSIDLSTKRVTFYDKEVEEAIKKYNIGGICLFQGGPLRQASLINHYQQISKTPILITID